MSLQEKQTALMTAFAGAMKDKVTEQQKAAADPDAALVEKWKRWKKECTDQRWVFERQWMRNIWYMLNRQWIYFDSKRGQWQDKRLAKWVPRPVTNICKEAVQTVRAAFAAINYGANARPVGENNLDMITASVADDYAPILHEDHDMIRVMGVFDWWLFVCGNALLHSYISYDRANGVTQNPVEQCKACGKEMTSADIANAQNVCPECGQPGPFKPAVQEDGTTPKTQEVVMPKGCTVALSPFEFMFPLIYENFEKSPYVVLMRWREKSWYEQHEEPELQALARTLPFQPIPQERSMQIFKTLPFQSDLGIAPPYFASGGANTDTEGVVEYDVWIKPCADYPQGYVVRFAGESEPKVIHVKNENLPGPLPYKTAKGTPIFPFHFAMFDYVGGRPFGSSLIDPVIQKQDQLNQVDSMMLMIIMRMSNPIWLEPKGAEVEKFTGEPGLVVKWNPLVSNGAAKPERIPGENIPPSLFTYRELLKSEAEELTGTFDLLKGSKPSGVEAYAAMNLLLERSQARFTTCFKERGRAYRGWFEDALILEQQFGEDTRVKAVMSKTRGWAFQTFKKADLAGSVEIIIEDGTLSPKTSLGERASIEHLRSLGFINPADPDQQQMILQKFGQSSLMPSLDAQVQEAWRIFDQFEQWAVNPSNTQTSLMEGVQAVMKAKQEVQQLPPGAPPPQQPPPPPQSPLQLKPWHNPMVFRNEFIKWCVSDNGRDVFEKNPQSEFFASTYLQQINQALMALMPQQPGQSGPPAPSGNPMSASNQNAAGAGASSSGSMGTSQNNIEANAQKAMGAGPVKA